MALAWDGQGDYLQWRKDNGLPYTEDDGTEHEGTADGLAKAASNPVPLGGNSGIGTNGVALPVAPSTPSTPSAQKPVADPLGLPSTQPTGASKPASESPASPAPSGGTSAPTPFQTPDPLAFMPLPVATQQMSPVPTPTTQMTPDAASPGPIMPGDMPANTYSWGGAPAGSTAYDNAIAGGNADQIALQEKIKQLGLNPADVQFGSDGSVMYGSGPNAGHAIPGFGPNQELSGLLSNATYGASVTGQFDGTQPADPNPAAKQAAAAAANPDYLVNGQHYANLDDATAAQNATGGPPVTTPIPAASDLPNPFTSDDTPRGGSGDHVGDVGGNAGGDTGGALPWESNPFPGPGPSTTLPSVPPPLQVPTGAGTPSTPTTPYTPDSSLIGQTINAPTLDRLDLAKQYLSAWDDAQEPLFEQNLRRIAQDRAGAGQLGSGMLRGSYRDALNDFDTRRTTAAKGFFADALNSSMDDAWKSVGLQERQQAFQAGRADTAFAQQVELQKLMDSEAGQSFAQQMAVMGFNAQQVQQAFENAMAVQRLSDDQTGQAFWRALQQWIYGNQGDPADFLAWLSGQYARPSGYPNAA